MRTEAAQRRTFFGVGFGFLGGIEIGRDGSLSASRSWSDLYDHLAHKHDVISNSEAGSSPSTWGARMSLAKSGVTISAIEQAPFIYFDGVSCFGQHNGSIQIELAAHVLVPDGGGVKIDVIQTAHFRCSTSAALLLRDVLDKTLAMVQKGQSEAQLISPLKN